MLRKLSLRQKNGFLIKKRVALKLKVTRKKHLILRLTNDDIYNRML